MATKKALTCGPALLSCSSLVLESKSLFGIKVLTECGRRFYRPCACEFIEERMAADDVLNPAHSSHIHGQEREDHHGEGRDLKDGRRDGWEDFLQVDAGNLQTGKEECTECCTYRMPAAENNDGQCDPARSLAALRASPAWFDGQ